MSSKIGDELAAIASAKYGREVRTAMHDGLEKLENEYLDTLETVFSGYNSGWQALDNNGVLGDSTHSVTGHVRICKINGIVYINAEEITYLNSNNETTIPIAVIPDAMRPLHRINIIPDYPNSSADNNQEVTVFFSIDGSSSTSKWLMLNGFGTNYVPPGYTNVSFSICYPAYDIPSSLDTNTIAGWEANKPAANEGLWDNALNNAKLLLLGDSITQGAGADDLVESGETINIPELGERDIYSSGTTWALLLKSYLATQYPNITVVNHGFGGISIRHLAQFIDRFVPNDTTHCILGVGINSEGETSFDDDIKTIANYLRSKGIKIYAWSSWLGTHPNMSNINTAGRVQAALIHAYNACGVKCLPVYSLALKYIEDHNISFDSVMEWQPGNEIVHPNNLGHTILYRIIRSGFGF